MNNQPHPDGTVIEPTTIEAFTRRLLENAEGVHAVSHGTRDTLLEGLKRMEADIRSIRSLANASSETHRAELERVHDSAADARKVANRTERKRRYPKFSPFI